MTHLLNCPSEQYPIPPGGNFTYRFSTKGEYGFYWYHSHFRAYYDDAIRGPLMIRPSSSLARPFEQLATSNGALVKLLQAERDATPVLLTDWTHELSDAIYSQYFETGAFPFCVDSILANGYGKVECLPESILQAGVGLGLDTGMPGMSGVGTGNTTMLSTAAMQGMCRRTIQTCQWPARWVIPCISMDTNSGSWVLDTDHSLTLRQTKLRLL